MIFFKLLSEHIVHPKPSIYPLDEASVAAIFRAEYLLAVIVSELLLVARSRHSELQNFSHRKDKCYRIQQQRASSVTFRDYIITVLAWFQASP